MRHCKRRDDGTIHVGRNEPRQYQEVVHDEQHDQPPAHQVEEQPIHQNLKELAHQAVEQLMHQEVEQPVQGYHGGPYDPSLLTRYEGHVARKLWYGQVCN